MAYSGCNSSNNIGNYCFGQLMSFRNPTLNSKPIRDSASGHTELLASLAVTKEKADDQNTPTNNCPTNTGGPGDSTSSVCKIPMMTIGLNRTKQLRLVNNCQNNSSSCGVDNKHGSYHRYLLRKKGWVLRNQSC